MKKEIPVLYEDDSFIVFDKPSGLLVIPAPQIEHNTLVNIVNQQYADKGFWRLWPCHRLDKETSGAILFAKGKSCQKMMMEIFKQRAVTKKYIAFVHGRLSSQQGELRSAICSFDRKKFRKNVSAQLAITGYKVIEQKKMFSIVEVRPVTGRTNQIRIHFSQEKHPLVGDRKYAFGRDYSLKFRRTALHAAELGWKHPVTGQKIKVQSVLPKDMEEFAWKQ